MTGAPQGSAAWLAARRGRVTASRLGDLMAAGRDGKPAASRRAYLLDLVVERLTGAAVERYVSAAMQHGIDHEGEARTAYEWMTDLAVEPVGFVPHPAIPAFGASPDGLVGEDGLIEIKCPTTATHLGTLLGEPIDRRYVLQMHGQMACTGRAWCDFVSFDPRLPSPYDVRILRVVRDEALVAEIEAAVRAFADEMEATLARLAQACGVGPEAPMPPLPGGIAEAAAFLGAG